MSITHAASQVVIPESATRPVPAPVRPAASGAPAPSRWTTQSVVATMALISLVPMAITHLTGTALNPLLAPISHYVFLPGGYLMVLLGSLLLAGCGLVIAAELVRRTGDHRLRVAAGLLISFAVALVLVGLFPTDPPGTPVSSASAVVHRIGAAWSFLALPTAGVLVGRTVRAGRPAVARGLVGVAAALLGAAVIFLSIHLTLALHGSGMPLFGLLERLGFAFMISYLILVAVALRTAAVPDPVTDPSARPAEARPAALTGSTIG